MAYRLDVWMVAVFSIVVGGWPLSDWTVAQTQCEGRKKIARVIRSEVEGLSGRAGDVGWLLDAEPTYAFATYLVVRRVGTPCLRKFGISRKVIFKSTR